MKGFLWNQKYMKNGKAKVSWKLVCSPKSQGGLGLKNLSLWNEVLMSKHIWNIAANKESLWVRWINVIRLKGQSIWNVGVDANASAGWKHILSLRGVIGDVIPLEEIKKVNLDLNMKVCEMIDKGEWNWPKQWEKKFSIVNSIPVPNLKPNSPDSTLWTTKKGVVGKFGTMREEKENVQWWNLFPKNVWEGVLRLIPHYQHTSCDWETLIDQASNWPNNKSVMSILRRISLAACVYYIWIVRNKRLFTNEVKDREKVLKEVINTVWLKLSSLKVKGTTQVKRIEELWNVKMNIHGCLVKYMKFLMSLARRMVK
ncbi:hypothetical protein Tco_0025712 [Tanacetum coccineum]